MKPKKIVLLAITLLLATAAKADDATFERIKSAGQLTDSTLCLITFNDGTNFRNLYYKNGTEGVPGNVLMFESNKSYPTLAQLTDSTQLFMIVKSGGHWLLQNLANKKFVGSVTPNGRETISYNNLFLHSDSPTEKFYLSFQEKDDSVQVVIGDNGLRYNTNAESFRLLSPGNSSMPYAALYKVSLPKPEEVLTLTPDKELGSQNFSGTVKLDRKFEDGYYNTLFLPFDVDSPQDAFGSKTACYKPSASSDSTITFAKTKPGESLKANTPYLIFGSFNAPPYTFKSVSFTHDGQNNVIDTTIGPMTLHGVYKTQDVGGTNAFILFQKGFYVCTKLEGMTVAPYKWYITCNKVGNAKISIRQADGATDSISLVNSEQESVGNSVFNLQGMKVSQSASRLPKGVYIVRGRKVVIR